jgi:hypothetical protein
MHFWWGAEAPWSGDYTVAYLFKAACARREIHLLDALRARAIAAEAPDTCERERLLALELGSLILWGLWGDGMFDAAVTAGNYRKRAIDLRKEALGTADANTKKILFSMADKYELLAMNAECSTSIPSDPAAR